ncbi:MAG: hypothetical protein KF744_12885 [Taibaiella sp.]|nr:hypothetical protein [Taibaiella sp.]
MTEIDILNDIKNRYSDENLNEADTRYKIIDTILERILKWPKHPLNLEVYINGGKADYVLRAKNSKPILVIESKQLGTYFDLPKSANNDKLFEKILVEKLLSNKEINSAIHQVKEYAEDLLCPYAAICNGKVWILFKISSNIKPWKKLPAFVIKNIDYFINDFTHALSVLGFESVTNNDSLGQFIGVAKKTYAEIFYPKNNITSYNIPVSNNKYAGPLKTISKKYLGAIPEADSEFMRRCYVTNKGKHDDLQKSVQGLLHDSLTPYYKNLGFRDFTDDKSGGALGLKIAEIVKRENLDNVIILFGGRGAGKSTFLKRFLFHTKPIEIEMYSHVALVALLKSSQTPEELTTEIWSKVIEKIDKENYRNSDRETLLSIFKSEFDVFERQILVGLEPKSETYQELVRGFIKEKTSDVKLFCEKISLKWKDKNKALVIFIDNMDQLPPELQDVCFLTAGEIADRLSCLVIVSMREERYFNAKSRGVLDAYENPGFHLSSPVIPEVVVKRIDYILQKLGESTDPDMDYGIKSGSELATLVSFFNICRNQLIRKTSPLSYFLRYATHGDVRQALEFFKGFLTSGYTNISEMAPIQDWVFQVHQVVKPMMIPERFFYDEAKSKIPNLFQLRNDTESSHFTGLRILNVLHNRSGDISSNGFIDVKYLIQNFDTKYDAKNDCINHLSLFLEKGIVEANNRLEKYSDEIDQIKITALGNYIFEFLVYNFAYVDLVSLDTGLFDESLHNYFVKSAAQETDLYFNGDFMSRIELRIERVNRFIEYLSANERQEFIDLNLDSTEMKFSEKLKINNQNQIQRIRRSATNKLFRDEYV